MQKYKHQDIFMNNNLVKYSIKKETFLVTIQEGIEEMGTGCECDPLKHNWKDQQKLKFLFSSYPPKYGIKRGPYEHMMEHRSVVTEDINSWIVEFSSDVWITSKIITKFWWSYEITEKQNIMSQRKQPEFWMTANYVHVGRLFIMIRFYSSRSIVLHILFQKKLKSWNSFRSLSACLL